MKVAVTVAEGTGRISPLFEAAEHIELLQWCRGGVHLMGGMGLPADEAGKIAFLRELGVRMLICGAVSNGILEQLRGGGISVRPFVSGEWREVTDAVLFDGLPPVGCIMPGCGKHYRRCRRGSGGGTTAGV